MGWLDGVMEEGEGRRGLNDFERSFYTRSILDFALEVDARRSEERE